MAGNPLYQNLDPASPPDSVTPADSPSDAAGFGMVAPHGRGTAPYDIQAPNAEAEITAAFDGANALAGSGVLYPQGPRQAQTEHLLSSPQGFAAGGGTSGFDITAGFSGGGGESWPNDVQPSVLATPDQGTGDYPGTGTD